MKMVTNERDRERETKKEANLYGQRGKYLRSEENTEKCVKSDKNNVAGA